MSDEKRDPMLETDAPAFKQAADLDGPLSVHARHVGRIRREFLCQAALNVLTGSAPSAQLQSDAWDIAEELLREGQRRGVLP